MRARRAGPLAAGALVGDRRGAVVSVHARAVHVLLDGGPLLVLLPDWTPLHPWAVVLALDAAAFGLLAEGEPVRLAHGVLEAGPLTIELQSMDVPELKLDRRARPLVAERVRALARLQPERDVTPGPFDATLDPALERFRLGGESTALAAVLGVGEGLTPSGDDLLTGVLAGLDAAHRVGPEAGIQRERLIAVLGTSPSSTTRLSAQLLAAAAAGLYSEPVLEVLEALETEPPVRGALEHAVQDLLAVGHRTGADTLRGIVAALERVTREPKAGE
jgi:hypothetical protein